MSWWVSGSMLVSTLYSGYAQKQAGKKAGQIQSDAANAGIDATSRAAQASIQEQRRQFDKSMSILNPYVMAGYEAMGYEPPSANQIGSFFGDGTPEPYSPDPNQNIQDAGKWINPISVTDTTSGGDGISRYSPGREKPRFVKLADKLPGFINSETYLPNDPFLGSQRDEILGVNQPEQQAFQQPSQVDFSPTTGVLPPVVGAFNPSKGLGFYRGAGDVGMPILNKYAESGSQALDQQSALSGQLGPEAQKQAIAGISGGEEMNSLLGVGENALLQNASATGGIRGGNTQAALAEFRPRLLSSLIDRQYGRLAGLSSQGGNVAQYLTNVGQTATGQVANLGQAAAANQAAASQQTGANIASTLTSQGTNKANLLGQIGQANAGAQIAKYQAYANGVNGLAGAFQAYGQG